MWDFHQVLWAISENLISNADTIIFGKMSLGRVLNLSLFEQDKSANDQ